MISKIKEIDASNKNISRIIVFDERAKAKDLAVLYEEFDYPPEHIEKAKKLYRNVAMVLDLKKVDEEYAAEWQTFLEKAFPKSKGFSKLENIFVNKGFNKLLLITNRRLVTVDMKRINEKVKNVNYEIAIYNESIKPKALPERKGFLESVKKIFS